MSVAISGCSWDLDLLRAVGISWGCGDEDEQDRSTHEGCLFVFWVSLSMLFLKHSLVVRKKRAEREKVARLLHKQLSQVCGATVAEFVCRERCIRVEQNKKLNKRARANQVRERLTSFVEEICHGMRPLQTSKRLPTNRVFFVQEDLSCNAASGEQETPNK